jgi:hypothetical protein
MFVTPFDRLDTWAMPKVGFEPTKHNAADFKSEKQGNCCKEKYSTNL